MKIFFFFIFKVIWVKFFFIVNWSFSNNIRIMGILVWVWNMVVDLIGLVGLVVRIYCYVERRMFC